MLYELVERICTDVDHLDMKASHSELREQIQRHAPDTLMAFADNAGVSNDVAAEVIAAVAMFHIKSVSVLGRQLAEKSRNETYPVAVRLAIASVLLYLVQPRDLIPDNAPAGYGMVDDAVLLRAGYVEYLRCFPLAEWSFEQEAAIVNHLVHLCPMPIRSLLLQAISRMDVSLQLYVKMGHEAAEFALQQIVANPLAFTPPAAPPGFVPRPATRYAHSSLTPAFFHNGAVVIPNGPVLIDGQLIVPS